MTILLNMIVKNESSIIGKTLTNLCEKINFDYWVISDTGSTDNTKEIITTFFEKKGINGELHEDEWQDFAWNRTKALEYAYDKTDLLLVFDADDELHGEITIPTDDYDSYHFRFGIGNSMGFWRVCIVNNRKRWKYVGVLHEYIHLIEGHNRTTYLQGNYYIQANTSGERARDPLKYQKDAALLSKAFNELPEGDDLRNRYAFYCANSYKDAGDYENAIEWYKKTINLNGWIQEKYRCCICLHNIYKTQNETEKAMYWAVKSLKFDKTRAEGVFKLVQHYCCEGQNDVAYMYYTMIQDWYENSYINDTSLSGKLFADMLDFDFYLPYYMIIVSDNVGKKEVGVKMYNMIFTKKKMAPQWWIDNLLYNFQFFYTIIPKTDTEFISKAKEYLKLLEENKYAIKDNFYRNLYELIS